MYEKIILIGDPSLGEEGYEILRQSFPNSDCVIYDVDRPETREKCRSTIADSRAEIYLSFCSDLFLPPWLLERARTKVNIHPTTHLRPGVTYGTGPILDGDKLYGSTLHRMTKDIDAGRIVEVLFRPLEGNESYIELRRKWQRLCIIHLQSVVEKLRSCSNVEAFDQLLDKEAQATNLEWGTPHVKWPAVNQGLLEVYRQDPNHRVFVGNKRFFKYLQTVQG